MANVLRQLVVNMKANTAAFIGDMEKSAIKARQVGRQIQGSFSQLGSVASTALAPFGAMGSLVASSLSGVGVALGKNLSQTKSMGSLFKATSVGMAASAAAVSAGAVGMAMHSINAAAALGRLSQQTGVSVEALSGLGFAAKRSGLDQESFVAALGKMNKAVFAAITAPDDAKNAFTRLGVSVKDSAGNVRSTESIFTDLAEKFSKLPDGPVKSALAMQLFGKSGAQLIPMLNKGSAGINELLNMARELGITLDGKTVAAAGNVRKAMGLMAAAGDGLTNKLMIGLLPTFTAVSNGIVRNMSNARSGLSSFVDGMAWMVKSVVSAGGLISAVFSTIGNLDGKLLGSLWIGLSGIAKAGKDLIAGNFESAASDAKGIVNDQINLMKAFGSETADTWSNYAKMSVGIFSKFQNPAEKTGSKPGTDNAGVDVSPGDSRKKQQNPVTAELAQMQEKLRASRDMLAVADQDEATQRKAQAAAEANTAILKLGEQVAKQKGVATKDYTSLVDAATQSTIRSTFAEIAENKAKSELATTLAKATRDNTLAITQSGMMVLSIQQGAAAVERSNALAKAQNELRDKGATQAQVQARAEQILAEQRAADAVTVQQQIEDAKFDLEWQEKLTAAQLRGAAAIRAVELAREQARIDRGTGTDDQKRTLKGQAEARSQQGVSQTVAEATAQLVNADSQRLDLLQQQRKQLASMQISPSVLMALRVVDTEIEDIYKKITLATGSASDGARTFFDGMATSAHSAAQDIYEALSTTFSSLNQQLTAAMTGQKANWAAVFKSGGQQLISSGLQRAESGVAKALGFGKADGSKGNPFHVTVDNPGFGAGKGGSPAEGAGTVAGGAGTAAGGTIFSSLSNAFRNAGSFAGKIFGALGKLFGGFFANGGDPDPYKASVVGERGPELFVPRVAGTVVPNRALNGLGGSQVVQHFNIDATGSNPADVDMRVRQGAAAAYAQVMQDAPRQQTERARRRPMSFRG